MFEEFVVRLRVKVRAVLPQHWLGKAGQRFRKTGGVIAAFSRERIRPEERIDELPDLAWNRVQGEANEKHSKALLNFADEESKRISNELSKRILDDKAREARASADKMESDARLSQTNEIIARIALIERLRQIGIIPIWNGSAQMTLLKAPANYDWDALNDKLISSENFGSSISRTAPTQGKDILPSSF